MSSDPIEVLRELRQNYGSSWPSSKAGIAALDAALASLSAPKPESAEAVFNCPTCPVSVQSRWQEPECPECGERCYLDPTAAPSPPRPEASAPFGECGCGKPVDYFDVMGRPSCNKLVRCADQQASAPVGVEAIADKIENDRTYWRSEAVADLRALAQPPAADPERIVLWSRGVAPNWYFIAEKANRLDIDGMPVYETLDEIVLRSSRPQVPPGYVLIAEPVLRELVGDERMDQIRTMCRHSTGEGQ